MTEQGMNICNVKAVYKAVLFGTYCVVGGLALLLLISFSLGREGDVGLLVVCSLAIIYSAAIWFLARQKHYVVVAYLLLLFYLLLSLNIIWWWGINTPIGLLILCVVIVLSGMLLSARHAPLSACIAGLILLGVQTVSDMGWHQPDMSWTGKQSSYGDAAAYCVIFAMLALISWLYNREMEGSLARARQAEVALSWQKIILKQKVEQRTTQLRQVQLKEMQQMYRFAELGQLGVTLLHDLANHLTVLTLEIDSMQDKKNSKAIERAQVITGYLEEMVDNTRSRLHGNTQKHPFNIVRQTGEVVDFLGYKAAKAKVTIDWHPPKQAWKYVGDPTCYSQIITIIMSNAIDAYATAGTSSEPKEAKRLEIAMQRDEKQITITISDWGKGFTKIQRKHLFKPFHTTKKTGLGIGLFIARQTVEINFGGTITLNPNSDHTEFIIRLPLQHEK